VQAGVTWAAGGLTNRFTAFGWFAMISGLVAIPGELLFGL